MLCVWLPLNGDLHNQGLSNFNIVTNNVTFVNTGKIGQCANFNGSNSYIYINNVTLGNNWSYGCWVNTPASDSRGWEIVIILNNTGSDTDSQLAFWVHQKENRFETLANTQYNSTVSYAAYYGTWHHFFATFNGNILTTYMDGIIVNTKTITAAQYTGTNLTIGARCTGANGSSFGNYFQGQLNDVRIYDHCLSDKEVKEIAKGLVLHYKLDDSYVESSTILTSGLTSTAYNGTTGKYGYNTDSNLGKIEGHFQGKDCIKIYTLTAGQTARPYVYFSNLFTSDGTNQPAYKALSFDYYTTVTTTTWLNIYKLGSGEGTATWKTTNSDGIHSGTYTNSANSIIVKPNEWNHVEVIFHGTTTANAEWGYCINGPNHTSSADNYFLYANIQLEQNDHVTGYGANFHSHMIYDSSGYSNNGSLLGASITNQDTIRYNLSTFFDGNDDGILIEDLELSNIINNQVTYSFWVKPSGENGARSVYFGSYSGTSWSIEKTTGNVIRSYWNGSPDTTCTGAVIMDNVWQHICIVKNGTSDLKVYINGEIKFTSTATLSNLSFPTTYRIGRDVRTGDGTPYHGNMSDFRIYATALTAEQVAELYHTSATIDNKGNMYARELVEE